MKEPPKAVALKYDSATDSAPKVVAKGRGKVAEKIIALAREAGVPLMADPNLAQVLEKLEVDMEIPPELYRAVAEVLIFVYRLNASLPARETPPHR